MAESEFQLVPMLYVLNVLRMHFRDREDVYVGGDMFVYYEEGNPGAVVAPDVFVVIGAPKRAEHPRDTYKLWEEPKGPDFVLEILSSSTWKADLGPKRALYASLGVTEYWLFDPTREHLLSPPLRGMRLAGREAIGTCRSLQVAAGAPTLRSEVLGLDLRLDRGALRFWDVGDGRGPSQLRGGAPCPAGGGGPGRAGGRRTSAGGCCAPAGDRGPRGGRGAVGRVAGRGCGTWNRGGPRRRGRWRGAGHVASSRAPESRPSFHPDAQAPRGTRLASGRQGGWERPVPDRFSRWTPLIRGNPPAGIVASKDGRAGNSVQLGHL